MSVYIAYYWLINICTVYLSMYFTVLHFYLHIMQYAFLLLCKSVYKLDPSYTYKHSHFINSLYYTLILYTGWFKDKVQLDIINRSDKTAPIITHPLSYIELKKYNYDYLTPTILSLGGPESVGDILQIKWTKPKIEKILPPRKVIVENKAGKLSLGSSFESLLDDNKIINMDMLQLKQTVNLRRLEEEDEKTDTTQNSDLSSSENGIDYSTLKYRKSINKTSKTIKSIENNKNNKLTNIDIYYTKEEKFKLIGYERLYTIIVLVTASFGFGHATYDLLDRLHVYTTTISSNNINYSDSSIDVYNNILSIVTFIHDTSIILCPLLCILSVVNSIRAGLIAKAYNRNIAVWGVCSICFSICMIYYTSYNSYITLYIHAYINIYITYTYTHMHTYIYIHV